MKCDFFDQDCIGGFEPCNICRGGHSIEREIEDREGEFQNELMAYDLGLREDRPTY